MTEFEKSHPIRRKLWIVLPAILVVVVCLLCGWWLMAQSRVARLLAAARERGEPTTIEELEQYYVAPEREKDATAAWLKIGSDLRAKADRIQLVAVPPVGIDWPELEAARAQVRRNAGLVDEIRQSVVLDYHARYLDAVRCGELHFAAPLRACARALHLESRVRAHDGDVNSTVESLVALIALSESLHDCPRAFAQRLRHEYFNTAAFSLAEDLPRLAYSDDDLLHMQRRLEVIDFRSGLRLALIGERAFIPEWEQYWTATFGTRYEKWSELSVRSKDLSIFLSKTTQLIETTEKPWPRLLKDATTVVRVRSEATPLYVMTYYNVGSLYGLIREAAECETTRHLLIIQIALERYRKVAGKPPTALEELSPRFLEEIPLDPTTQMPFAYQREKASYVLHSPSQWLNAEGKSPDPDSGNYEKFVFRFPARNYSQKDEADLQNAAGHEVVLECSTTLPRANAGNSQALSP